MESLELSETSRAKEILRILSSFSRSPSLKNLVKNDLVSLTNSPIKFAEAGFECPENVESDEVFCKVCGLTYSHWEGESPLAVHRTLRPDCSFLNPPSPSRSRNESPANRRSLSLSLSSSQPQRTQSFLSSSFPQTFLSNNSPSARRQLFSGNESCEDNLFPEQPFCPEHRLGFLALFESHRLITFLGLDHFSYEAAIYAKCGFVYNSNSSKAMCVFCNLEVELTVGFREIDVEMQHEKKSPTCHFVSATSDYDVGNISRECERAIRDKVRNNNFCRKLNDNEECCRSPNNFKIKHPEFEEISTRIGTFQLWPRLVRDEFPVTKMAECGFYCTGSMDSVRCYCCGVGLRNWSKGADPFVQHSKASPHCLVLLQVKGQSFINAAQNAQLTVETDYSEMAIQTPGTDDDTSSTPSSSCSSSSSSSPTRSPHLDMAALEAALWGEYPNEELLMGTLKASDENHKQICQQREEIINKDSQLQAKDSQFQSELQAKDSQFQSVIQAKDSVIQAKDSVIQAKDRELARTRQTVQHQVREELEQVIEQLEQNREVIEQKDVQLEQNREVIEQNREVIEHNREVIEHKDEVIDNKNIQLYLKSLEVEDLKRHILSLRQELRRNETSSRSIESLPAATTWDTPNSLDMEEEFPVARCTVCLSNPSQIMFQPCGHLCCCDQCASKLFGKKCPICRETNVALEKVYVV